jgi:amino acid transporter
MNQSVPNPFIIIFYFFLVFTFSFTILAIGIYLYRYKFPNKVSVKRRRPKKYVIYAIYSNSASLVVVIFVLLYSILNINQLLFAPLGFDWFYLGLVMYALIDSPNLILELIYHLYWKQDFLKSQQQEGVNKPRKHSG